MPSPKRVQPARDCRGRQCDGRAAGRGGRRAGARGRGDRRVPGRDQRRVRRRHQLGVRRQGLRRGEGPGRHGRVGEGPEGGEGARRGQGDGQEARGGGPPRRLEDWPTDKAKYETFGGPEGEHSYHEGPEEEQLGPSSLRHHEDGRVAIEGEEVDDPDEYKCDPIPGGPTDEESNDPSAGGETDDDEEDERRGRLGRRVRVRRTEEERRGLRRLGLVLLLQLALEHLAGRVAR